MSSHPPPPGTGSAPDAAAVDENDELPSEATKVDDRVATQVAVRWIAAPIVTPTDLNTQARPATPRDPIPLTTDDSAKVLIDETATGIGPAKASGARLRVIAGSDRYREFCLPPAEISLGRGVDNDIILSDLSVSRHHLTLSFDGNRYAIRDAGSGNGTLLNDQPTSGTTYLFDGDRLELGNTVLCFDQRGCVRPTAFETQPFVEKTPSITPTAMVDSPITTAESTPVSFPSGPPPQFSAAPPHEPPSRSRPLRLWIGAAVTIMIATLAIVVANMSARHPREQRLATPVSVPGSPHPVIPALASPAAASLAPTQTRSKLRVTSDQKRGGAPASEQAAVGLYKNKDFSRAAEAMLAIAARSSGATAAKTRTIAADYATVATSLARAAEDLATKPHLALSAYRDALAADARSGHRLHAAFLRSQLAKVAPRAALAHFSAGSYEQAELTCQAAVNYGTGSDPVVARTQSMLDQKARDFYTGGVRLHKTDQAKARLLWSRVVKMVPADNPWHEKASAALEGRLDE